MASAGDHEIRTVAMCAGSGATVLKGVKADLYLTGELSHHVRASRVSSAGLLKRLQDVLAAVAQGTHVILTEHSNSERGYLKVCIRVISSSVFSS